jgi:hypothetical protein
MSTDPTRTFELLGSFYLGHAYDLKNGTASADPVLYDSRDLVTHAVIAGMTGSGKTGLGISLLEEAALDAVPVLAIDPKGDLSNLLLTFPDLTPGDFRPWIDEAEAAREGVTPDELAAREADRWRNGLAGSGQDGARIKRLRGSVDFAIYTPASRAGIPVSIVQSFAAPPEAERRDEERMAEAVTTTATGLLTLLGVDADPVQSREHILVSALLHDAWLKGENLDLAALIQRIQTPPFERVGVVALEAFYPEKERFALAMRLNGLLAAPGFALWLAGEPLDIASMLRTPAGKPRVAIVSIAHLSDAERMFFVTLLLNHVVSWMRAQSGTSSLRAVLYMDEVAGYMPPVSNPPSKQALLLLMKQARAFGLGIVLATQNPVDLDYKGLSNAGTWFLGRLQTERDKARLLDGLESALSGQASQLDRAETDRLLSSLPKRVFLMHDVHEDGPVVFQTRWAMSYLRGPMTREQIARVQPAAKEAPARAVPASEPALPPTARAASAPSSSTTPRFSSTARDITTASGAPVAQVDQFFIPNHGAGGPVHYEPWLYGRAQVRFVNAKRKVDVTRTVTRLVPFGEGALLVDWSAAELTDVPTESLERHPAGAATFSPLPPAAARESSYTGWTRDFARTLQQSEVLQLLVDDATGLYSTASETEADFRARVQLAAREARDAAKERLRLKYAPRVATLTEKKRRAGAMLSREEEQASQQKIQTAVSFGSTVLGVLLGRKRLTAGTVGRATTTARGVGRSMKETADIERAKQRVAELDQQLADLQSDLEAELAGLDAAAPSPTRAFGTLEIRPRRSDVTPERLVLVWKPS